MDYPEENSSRGSPAQAAAVPHRADATLRTKVQKAQPWKNFFQPQQPVSGKTSFDVVGDGSIRLTAELDDKDIGG